MIKRERLEIIRDILKIIQDSGGLIKFTPLLRKSNLSSQRFTEYIDELIKKEFIKNILNKNNRQIILTEKGFMYLKKYENIIEFIEEFGL